MQGVGLDHVRARRPARRLDCGPAARLEPPVRLAPTRCDWEHPSGARLEPGRSPATPYAGQRRPPAGRATSARRPPRRPTRRSTGRRPVVAILDTGCGEHPWLDGVVTKDVDARRRARSATDAPGHRPRAARRPGRPARRRRSTRCPGHGTFIAGLVHQACPDADIVSWRVVPSRRPDRRVGPGHRPEPDRRARPALPRPARPAGTPIDVLSLSMGYYHETPEDAALRPDDVRASSRDLASHGVVVVCSAGNDATSRPCFPAAFAPWSDGTGPVQSTPTARRSSRSARSTRTARPTRCSATPGRGCARYAPGRRGGEHHPADLPGRARAGGPDRRRSAGCARRIDPDDFRGGFARLERHVVQRADRGRRARGRPLLGKLELHGAVEPSTTAVDIARAWDAVRHLHGDPERDQ